MAFNQIQDYYGNPVKRNRFYIEYKSEHHVVFVNDVRAGFVSMISPSCGGDKSESYEREKAVEFAKTLVPLNSTEVQSVVWEMRENASWLERKSKEVKSEALVHTSSSSVLDS